MTRVHRAIATARATGAHHVAMGGARPVNCAVMVARSEIATMERESADQVATVNERALVVTSTLAKDARTMIRARLAKASIAKAGRTTSAAIHARSSVRHGRLNRRRARLESR